MRQGCGSKLVDNPISVQVCFNWRAPSATPACWLRISPNEERVSCGGDRGGGVTFPSSSFSSMDLVSEGASSLALSPPSGWLSKHVPFVFYARDCSLWAWFASHLVASSCKVTPRYTLQAYVRSCNQTRVQRANQIAQTAEDECEWTHLVLSTPTLNGVGSPQISPMS
jgi:hypothetical protein